MTMFQDTLKHLEREMENLHFKRGPDTETDDSKLTGTRFQMAIEHTDGSERFARPETRREGTEA